MVPKSQHPCAGHSVNGRNINQKVSIDCRSISSGRVGTTVGLDQALGEGACMFGV